MMRVLQENVVLYQTKQEKEKKRTRKEKNVIFDRWTLCVKVCGFARGYERKPEINALTDH